MPSNSTTAGALLGLHAQTSMHPGAGTALGVVDLPIQRERHTGWPTIAGSALKGVLRDAVRSLVAGRADLGTLERWDGPAQKAEPKGGKRQQANATLPVNLLFGPPTEGAGEFAGAISITDARILCFPVRSLRGVHAWVTCPAALDRLARDGELAGLTSPTGWPEEIRDNEAIVAPGCACIAADNKLLLEEYQFDRVGETAQGVAEWIANHLLPEREAYRATRARFARHFVLLSDNDFTHFVRHATEVSARIALDAEKKTTIDGALFYQEFLPPESILYAVILANPSRSRRVEQDAPALLAELEGHLKQVPILQIGGDETTGKGYCASRLVRPTGEATR